MRTSHARVEIECEETTAGPAEIHPFPAIRSVMDPRIYKIAVICWIGFLAVFWTTFWMSANALFLVAISTVYAVVFFGVPYAMSRQVRDRPETTKSLFTFLSEPFATLGGVLSVTCAVMKISGCRARGHRKDVL